MSAEETAEASDPEPLAEELEPGGQTLSKLHLSQREAQRSLIYGQESKPIFHHTQSQNNAWMIDRTSIRAAFLSLEKNQISIYTNVLNNLRTMV